jgi:hypothetical protein
MQENRNVNRELRRSCLLPFFVGIFLVAALAAAATTVTLLIRGDSHFELGFTFSLILLTVVALASYLVGALLLLVVRLIYPATEHRWLAFLSLAVLVTGIWQVEPLTKLLRIIPWGLIPVLYGLVSGLLTLAVCAVPGLRSRHG